MPDLTPTSPSGSPPNRFATTCWTQVVASRGDSSLAAGALSGLCQDYYEPIVTFIRYSERDEESARDLAHAFFAHVLEGRAFEGADRNRGRFRSYLLGAGKHCLAQNHVKSKRLRRGGDAEMVALDQSAEDLPNPSISPDDNFDRRWASTVLDRALDALKCECDENDMGDLFQHLSPWLTGDATYGNQADLAEQIQMDPNTLKSHVSRLRKQFRRCVRDEVARTLVDPAQTEEEMQTLLAVLRKK
jgi:RNA polymerase sigma-70 factor (ECF subfamily)